MNEKGFTYEKICGVGAMRAWMVFIFMMSAMPGDVSGEQSGFVTEMIEKALTFVFGAQTAGGIPVDALEMVVRKCAHMGEYAVLFWLWAHALSVSGAKPPARTALIVCAAYAASDEFHQCFSDGRGPSPVDVMIDTVGAAIALLRVRRRAYSGTRGGAETMTFYKIGEVRGCWG